MELAELHRTIHGRTAEREVASGEMYRKTRKTNLNKTTDKKNTERRISFCLCPLAASTSALVSARRCSWCRCMAAALALAPLDDIVRHSGLRAP